MAEQGTATEKVADDDLSAAWDQAQVAEEKKETKEPEAAETSEEKEVPPVEEPATEHPTEDVEVKDHKESSKLGRKVKGLEEQLRQMRALLEEKSKAHETSSLEMPEVVSTPEDVEQVLQAREQKSQKVRVEYERNYLKQVDSLKSVTEDDELHEEIVNELVSNKQFNVLHDINNPFADARVNYAEAKAFVLQKKLSGPTAKVPHRETSGKPPVQPAASTTRTPSRPVVMPKLDEETQNYVNYLRKQGMSEDDIAKELA